MRHCPRHPVLLLVAVLAAGLVGACGGSGGKSKSSADAAQLLRQTFSNSRHIRSATLDLGLHVDTTRTTAGLSGPLALRLSGPYQSQGGGRLPRFAYNATLQSGGQSFTAGATWTGAKGFLSFQGVPYAVSDRLARRFAAGYQQAMRSHGRSSGLDLATLGIDPTKWLKNPRNAGSARVGDADTTRITGTADVARVLDDVQRIVRRASASGLPGSGSAPQQLTPQERQALQRSVRRIGVQVYTGRADKLLRRLVIDADLTSAKVSLDMTYTKVNQPQRITAPGGARPFSDLVRQIRRLKGALGAVSGGSSSGGASTANLKKFSECVRKAGGDSAKQRKCANLLSP